MNNQGDKVKTIAIGLFILFGWVLILFGCNTKSNKADEETQDKQPFGWRFPGKNFTKDSDEEPLKRDKSTPVINVDLDDFMTQYDKNKLAHNKKYKGKWIQTTGEINHFSQWGHKWGIRKSKKDSVEGFSEGKNDKPVINLSVAGHGWVLSCRFDQEDTKVLDLAVGDHIDKIKL